MDKGINNVCVFVIRHREMPQLWKKKCTRVRDGRTSAGRQLVETEMGMLRRRVPSHYIPIHPDNVPKRHWIILLEAGTIVGPSAEKLRVAKATMERKVVTKYNLFLRKQHFLVLEDMIREFTRSISARSSMNWILTASSFRLREKKSDSCLRSRCSMGLLRRSRGISL